MEKLLREYLKRSEKSLSEIAKEAGVDYASLHRFLNQKSKIQIDTVQKLCKYFGLVLGISDSRVIEVLLKVASQLVAASGRTFRHSNGRINRDALREKMSQDQKLATDGLDRNELEVINHYEELGKQKKLELLEQAMEKLGVSAALERISQQIMRKHDQDLVELRDAYDQMSDEQKVALRTTIASAAKLSRDEHKLSSSHLISIRIKVGHSYCDHEGNAYDENEVSLSPSLAQKAIAAWDNGDEFLPTANLGDL